MALPRVMSNRILCLFVAAGGSAVAAAMAQGQAAPEPPGTTAAPGQQGDRWQREQGRREGQGRERRDDMDGPGGRGPGVMGWMVGGLGRTLQPDYVRRDMVVINQTLELDRAQRNIVESILLDYESEYELAAEAMREKFSALRPAEAQTPEAEAKASRRRELMDEMRSLRELMRESRRAREEAREQAGNDAAQALDEQAEAASNDVMEKVRARFDQIREELQELRPPMPSDEEMHSLMDRGSQLAGEWNAKRKVMRETFDANVTAVLTPEQIETMPELHRALRRQKSLPRGRIAGESADLFLLVRDLAPSQDVLAAVQPLLHDYGLALDEALVRRDAHLDGSQQEFLSAMRDRDVERALNAARKESSLRVAIRTVNDSHAQRIAESMPSDLAARLQEMYRTSAYERVYRPTGMQRTFLAAKKIEGLDPATVEAIQAIEQAYLSELASANERVFQALREQEPQEFEMRVQFAAARLAGTDPERPDQNPMRSAMQARRELEERYRPQLESLLTPEQVAALPDERRGDDQRGGWGRRRGFGPGQGFGPEGEIGERRERMLQRFDTNRDGELSEAERDAARRAMEAEAGG